ncbi:thioredoxin domain-containing protein [Occallatibacter riparius]|uniref:Thioredoxin domain-containing protein n=1 Tax=Occallatibacter riparius TaxID=1002689 RepID=A0A9J7BIK6_9BACT|nr:thioredoxin domain-containing protein [Occallatibacter riparius]UWZ82519.1 thioredoxin domain-containing protein [Occallatibacter riparius]
MQAHFPPGDSGSNRLDHSSSSYLRSARHQPVHWHPWGEEAFARARAEEKPILLDIGAVWCHWCHVMDRESYEDAETAAIVNKHFVAVKVDRDERPDVDSRYQAAVQAISGQGGWPLTAFLTPDGHPYFGGTYFPHDERYGRPGFPRVLETMAQVWKDRREEALESASSVMAAVEHSETFTGPTAELSLGVVDKIAGAMLSQFDARNGGFGSQPKFPQPAALDLLLEMAMNRDNEQARDAFLTTLEKMGCGGTYDHLAGGFHRYSVDERWLVPHFEKMLYDNTELLRNYVHGFQSYVRQDFKSVANHIMFWLDSNMTDRLRGGFYASQDADYGLDDDGDYFTWTLDEARAVLGPDELKAASVYYDIGELGDMHHNPAKNVLHVKMTREQAAVLVGVSVEQFNQLLASARSKMIAARAQRPMPFIDRTLYTGWNAMAITAYFEAGRVLRNPAAINFALLTLRRLLAEAWSGADLLNHVIAYSDQLAGEETQKIPGTLDDYAFTVHACLDGWFASGRMEFYRAAITLADAMIARFYDSTAGAFNDTASTGGTLGALTAKRKPLQDSPTPAGNPTAASALLRLEALSNLSEYRKIAETTLTSFAGIVEHLGLYAGSYGLALERLLLDPVQVVIVGSGAEAARLEALAVARYSVNKTVMRIGPFRVTPGGIPEALAQMLLNVPAPEGKDVWAIVCRGRTCLPPITDAEELLKALEEN